MDEITRALLGDHAAAERLTEQGVLLPCPFCGNKGRLSHCGLKAKQSNAPSSSGDFFTRWVAECSWCSCKQGEGTTEYVFNRLGELSVFGDDGRKKAIMRWNTRAPILSAEEMEMLEGME